MRDYLVHWVDQLNWVGESASLLSGLIGSLTFDLATYSHPKTAIYGRFVLHSTYAKLDPTRLGWTSEEMPSGLSKNWAVLK